MIVLDASAAVAWFEWQDPHAVRVEERVLCAASVHVPHLWFMEVAQVLRRHVLGGLLSESRGSEALADAADLRAARYAHEPHAERIWQLRDNLTAYDAVYVALAEAVGATLVTTDAKLANAPGISATIDLVG